MSLVEKTQGRFRAVQSVGGPGHLPMRDVAELEARARTLREKGHPFNHVVLSRYMTQGDAVSVLSSVGGEGVATEV